LYDVFKKAAPSTKIASVLWELLERVWRKSHENVHHPQSECIISRAELDRVGGGSTRLISKTSETSSSHSQQQSQTATAAYPNSGSANGSTKSAFDFSPSSIHPRIMQDMQSFDGFQASFTHDSATPKQFSQSMIDTQCSHFCADSDGGGASSSYNYNEAQAQAESMGNKASVSSSFEHFPPMVQTMPFFTPRDAYSMDGIGLDTAWQSFMVQLGF